MLLYLYLGDPLEVAHVPRDDGLDPVGRRFPHHEGVDGVHRHPLPVQVSSDLSRPISGPGVQRKYLQVRDDLVSLLPPQLGAGHAPVYPVGDLEDVDRGARCAPLEVQLPGLLHRCRVPPEEADDERCVHQLQRGQPSRTPWSSPAAPRCCPP